MNMEHKCLNPKCRLEWIGRVKHRPRECPSCKSREWWKEDKWEKKVEEKSEK